MPLHPCRRGLVLAAWTVAAGAQEASPAPSTLEKVEVVGSHIKRVEGETALPVTIIRRDEIEASGVTRVTELLLALPYTQGNFDDRRTGRTEYMGTAGVSMRGLGFGATLVLLNGRRIAPYGASAQDGNSFVDLNSLPLAAVDRVEVRLPGERIPVGHQRHAVEGVGVTGAKLRRPDLEHLFIQRQGQA